MKHLVTGVVMFALLSLPLGAAGQVVDIPMNTQINNGYTYNTQSPSGNAIYPAFTTNTITIYADGALEPEGFTRQNLLNSGWYYQYIDLNLAGITTPGTGLDLSNICARVEFDVRYFQDPVTNTNPYGDAPVFLRLYTYANDGNTYLGHRDYSIVYATQSPWSNPPYPTWTHVVVYVNKPGYADGGTFNVANVSRIRWYGTDWSGGGNDFVDWKNFQIFTNVLAPQIDPVPDPDLVYPTIPYTRQMKAFSCDGTLSWSVVSGPAGLTINPATGAMSGWTPTPAQAGQNFPVTVRATNGGGSTDLSYTIRVKEPPVLDGSNVAPPWGTIHATTGGPQSSNAPSMVLSRNWAFGAKVDWTLDVGALGLERAADRASITFDEDGNLYWKTTSGFLASVSPAGTLRWTGNDGGTPIDLGGSDSSSPVVGDGGAAGRVYAVSDTGVAAFRKSDGQRLWATSLPDANFAASGSRLTPALHNGVLYVVGTGTTNKAIIAVNASTGEVIFSSSVPTTLAASQPGQVALVADAFGSGLHGLYFNGDSSGGTGKEMYAVKINLPAYTATLEWSADGGKVARSHVIYIPSAGRVGTHCWNDYGATFYTWNLDGSEPAAINGYAGGHGFEDFGALDFDGNDVIAGGFSGRLARYIDIANPNFVDPPAPTEVLFDTAGFGSYTLGSVAGQDGWQLDNYGTITAAGEILEDPTGSGKGKVMKLQSGTSDTSGWMGVFKPFTNTKKVVTFEFDVYRADNLNSLWVAHQFQFWNGWWAEMSTGGLAYARETQGLGISLSTGSWHSMKYLLDMAAGKVTLTVDGTFTTTGTIADSKLDGFDLQLNPGGNGPIYVDNVVVKQGDPDPAFIAPFGGHGWYLMNADYLENRGIGGLYQNELGDSIYVASNSNTILSSRIIGYDVSNSELKTESPPATIEGQTPRLFEFDTTDMTEPRGGPVLGPKIGQANQHIYYFSGTTQTLVAITHNPKIPGDFDFDQDVDMDDLATLMDCAAGAAIDVTAPGCAETDMDTDGDVDSDDFAGWQRCYSGQNIVGNPNCND